VKATAFKTSYKNIAENNNGINNAVDSIIVVKLLLLLRDLADAINFVCMVIQL